MQIEHMLCMMIWKLKCATLRANKEISVQALYHKKIYQVTSKQWPMSWQVQCASQAGTHESNALCKENKIKIIAIFCGFATHDMVFCQMFCFNTYCFIDEHNNIKVGMTKSISAKALTAGCQNVKPVQMAAQTLSATLNIFLYKVWNGIIQ